MTETHPQEFIGGPKDGDHCEMVMTQPILTYDRPTVGRTTQVAGRYRYEIGVDGDYRFADRIG